MLATFTLHPTNAQLKEGKIVYEQRIDLHRRMQDEQMRAMVPQFRASRFELNFATRKHLLPSEDKKRSSFL